MTAAETIAHQIAASARDLAVRIEAGLFDALDADARCDLRGLTLAMSGWSEGLVEAEQERQGEHFARASRLFGNMRVHGGMRG